MLPELLLGSVFAVSSAGVGYLVYEHKRSRRQRAEEEAKARDAFRHLLVQELKRRPPSQFNFSEFRDACEMPHDQAEAVAIDLYLGLSRKVMSDGVIEPSERKRLDVLARALDLSLETAGRIEANAKGDHYRQAVQDVLNDGVVSEEEAAHLESLRRSLGMSLEAGLVAAGTAPTEAYLEALRRIAIAGSISPEVEAYLLRLKTGLGITQAAALSAVRKQALTLYRQCFAVVIQDGEVTPEEERFLDWMRRETGLTDEETAGLNETLQEAKRLAKYRKGFLPTVPTRRLLEGGELCHWDSPCVLHYQTRTQYHAVSGNLLVTSKRIVFTSPTKTASFSPSRILDLEVRGGRLVIEAQTRTASGVYQVENIKALDAVLCGLVRKHKFMLSESYSSTKTRHIPDDVKRLVWDRDCGRCVRCGADDYLEFDHIIPHAKGGANTFGNVQLLCRRCNLQKSDRI